MHLENKLSVISRLLRAMAASQSADEFCDFLANDVLSSYGIVATYLAVLDSDGRVSMVGSWGYPASRRSPDDRPSLWQPMAITDTIRTGEIHIYDSWQAYMDKYPDLGHRASPGKAFVCVPFTNQGKRTGGLGITFSEELTSQDIDKEFWQVIAEAGDLFVTKSWAGKVFKTNSKSIEDVTGSYHQDVRSSLTARDLQVIKMTIDGKTMQQIGRALNFSASTIKQSRMAIYKKLGVTRGADLVHAVKLLGLFDDLD